MESLPYITKSKFTVLGDTESVSLQSKGIGIHTAYYKLFGFLILLIPFLLQQPIA